MVVKKVAALVEGDRVVYEGEWYTVSGTDHGQAASAYWY
jgi:hypothetical protein